MAEGLDKIYFEETTEEKTLSYQGVEIKVLMRELTWNEKTKILEEAIIFEDNKQKFLIGKYFKEYLKRAIVKAPWGKTDELFFNKINRSFGDMLSTLVPKPEENNMPSFLEKDSSSS